MQLFGPELKAFLLYVENKDFILSEKFRVSPVTRVQTWLEHNI